MNRSITTAIDKGIKYLQQVQMENGAFPAYFSNTANMEEITLDDTPFPTVITAAAIARLDKPKIKTILEGVVNFLVAECEGTGIWKYWTKKHPNRTVIPPDLDDMACISAFLESQGAEFPSNKHLFYANRNGEGLFFTWLFPRPILVKDSRYWRVVLKNLRYPIKRFFFYTKTEAHPYDVDAVVNANVLYYLGKQPDTQAVIDYLCRVVQQNSEDQHDKWYLHPFFLYYAIAKNYQNGCTEFARLCPIIQERIAAHQHLDGRIGDNVLHTALSVCILSDLELKLPNMGMTTNFILQQQDSDGSWPRYFFYYGGPKSDGKSWYSGWGCEALTTGLCLEALYKLLK